MTGVLCVSTKSKCSTAHSIATFVIHSKLDYCNCPLLNLPQFQLGRLQLIVNSTARAVYQTCKLSHIVLKSLHRLKVAQRILHKVQSINYNTLQPGQHSYLHSLLNVQSNHLTRSSDIITLQRPPVRFLLELTDRSLTHNAPVLWNILPKHLRLPSVSISRHSNCFCSSSCPLLLLVSL